jgi:hypothetical protein
MGSERTEAISVGNDLGLINAVVRELAGARRNVSSYPQGHPVVVQSCERAAEMLERLCEDRSSISFGVARETLLIGGRSLGNLVPAAKNFTRTLAHHGIALVTFHKGVSAAEIEKFSQILKEKRADISAIGGIEQVVHDAGIKYLEVSGIKYDGFQVAKDFYRDESGELKSCWRSLWETFVENLMLDSGVFASSGMEQENLCAPEEMGGLVNSQSPDTVPRITAALEELFRETGGMEQLSSEEKSALANIGKFVGGLKPELRRQFFDGVLQFGQQQDSSCVEIVPYLPTAAALEFFSLSQENSVVLPSHIMDSLEHLTDALVTESAQVPTSDQLKPLERQDSLNIIFREDIVDEFVPADYLDTLKTLVASQKIPEPSREDFLELMDTLSDDQIVSSVSKIILESLYVAGPEQLFSFKRNLRDLCRYFLVMGDFQSLENMHVRLRGTPLENGELAELKTEILEMFQVPEFIAEVLNGVDNWGKDKFEEIGNLIQAVGEPFVEQLLDRLAEEERLTLRRYFLDQLLKMSDRAKEAVYARLGDSRWYFIRNLVCILEYSGDQKVLVHLRKVASFPHPKVRQRVIEAFLSFGDSEGDTLLLQDLTGRDAEARQSAIQQSGRSRSPEVFAALIGILKKKGMSPVDFMEKKSVIQALADMGDGRVIPLFDWMLTSRHFLRRALWKSLKKEIVQSLVKYSDPSALGLLYKVAKSGQRELASLAAQLKDSPGERG